MGKFIQLTTSPITTLGIRATNHYFAVLIVSYPFSYSESDHFHFASSNLLASFEPSSGEHQQLHTHATYSINVDTHSHARHSRRWDDASYGTPNSDLCTQYPQASCDDSHTGPGESPFSQGSCSVNGQSSIRAVTGKPASACPCLGSGTWAPKGSITRVQLPYGISLVLLKMPDCHFFVPYCQVLTLFRHFQDGHCDRPSTPSSPAQPHLTSVLEGPPTTTFRRRECPELYDMTIRLVDS